MMKLSVVIPAYNEEKYLRQTLEALMLALSGTSGHEVIVVDNESNDGTAAIAADFPIRTVVERTHNIGAVRNTGGREATGEILFFLDADTLVSPGTFERVIEKMADPKCLGGAMAVEYLPAEKRRWTYYYLLLSVYIGRLTKLRGGAGQFCRSDIFKELGGYDETIYVGEDIEFQWRLDALAKRRKGHVAFIETPRVRTSARRFDKMGLIRMMIVTHPITIFLLWRRRSLWKDWYDDAVR